MIDSMTLSYDFMIVFLLAFDLFCLGNDILFPNIYFL